MAEAIIVMTILGIIATIMITNLKPTEFRDKALQVAAKKVLREIDEATNQILINNTLNGTFSAIYHPENNTLYHANENGTWTRDLYKKYMPPTRKVVPVSFNMTLWSNIDNKLFRIKDGACMAATSESWTPRDTIFPGENTVTNTRSPFGFVYFDVNCEEEPNILGKDQFVLPLGERGINYE